MRQKLGMLATLMIVLAIVAACSGADTPSNADDTPTTTIAPVSQDQSATSAPEVAVLAPTQTPLAPTATLPLPTETAPPTATTPPPTETPTLAPEPTNTPRPPRATRTPRPEPTPTPAPTPPPHYVYLDEGMRLACEAVYGTYGNCAFRMPYQTDASIQATYHLTSASVGSFNPGYDDFFSWLQNYVTLLAPRMYANASDDTVLMDWENHINLQRYYAIFEPTSHIGSILRNIESVAYTYDKDAGAWMVYNILLNPAITMRTFTTTYVSLLDGHLENEIDAFLLDRVFTSGTPSLYLEYLRTTGLGWYYIPRDTVGIPNRPGSNASPTATPTAPSRATATPSQSGSGVLYDRPLNQWRADDYGHGFSEPTNVGLEMTVYANDSHNLIEAWTDRTDFGNIRAEVTLTINSESDSAGCLSVRHDADTGDYSLCLARNGDTNVLYNYIDGAGNWQVDELISMQPNAGIDPLQEWVRIGIAANGSRLTFYVNGEQIGQITHTARQQGAVAISVINWDPTADAIWEFQDLVVTSLR